MSEHPTRRASLVVGLILTPVARRWQMPFAAIGFAAVVSMMPGVFLFRMASGLLLLTSSSNTTLALLGETIADGMTATTIILAMSLGLIVPKVVIDSLWRRGNAVEVLSRRLPPLLSIIAGMVDVIGFLSLPDDWRRSLARRTSASRGHSRPSTIFHEPS